MKSLLEIVKNEVERKYKNENDFDTSLIYGMGKDDSFHFLLDVVMKKMKDESNQILHGICFSEDGDLLGQWREYADKGRGLSIGFRVEWFKRSCSDNDLFKFEKVMYENSDKVFSSEIKDVAEYIKSIFIKREEYMEEKEWRLIINDEKINKFRDDWSKYYNWKGEEIEGEGPSDTCNLMPNALEFMIRRNRIVSYLDLKYDTYEDELPVEKVIIGPNCKVTEGDIFHLLEFYGFDGRRIEIVKSKSSYSI